MPKRFKGKVALVTGGASGIGKVATLEYTADGIRVNTILPGPTERTLLMDYLTSGEPEVQVLKITCF